MTALTPFRTTKEQKQVKVSISYQQQEVDKVLKMESELMKHYGYNRSQLQYPPTHPPTNQALRRGFPRTSQDSAASQTPCYNSTLRPVRTRQHKLKTERVGFEPTDGCPSNDFESFAFDHSATSPDARKDARQL